MSDTAVTRASLAQMPGPVVVEFGASWCPICRGFAPQFAALLQDYPDVQHIKIEDGKGQPLGRSFRVTLWPTFVFQRDGNVQEQLVRPSREAAREALQKIAEPSADEA